MNIADQLTKALNYCQSSDFDKAIPIFKNILRKKPDQIEAIANLAVIFSNQKKFTEAEKLFSKAITYGAKDRNIIFNQINIKIELKKIDEANQLLEQFNQTKDIQFYLVNLKILRIKNKKSMAMDVINEITHSSFYQNYELRLGVAYTYNYFKNYPEAICLYKDLYKENKQNLTVLFNLGVSLNNNHNYSEAVEYFRKAEEYTGFDSTIKKNIAASFLHQEMYSAALDELQKCIKIDKSDYDCHMKMAYIHILEEKISKAIEIYDEVIAVEPTFYTAWQDKSFIKLVMSEFSQGWDLYRYRQLQDSEKCKVDDFGVMNIDWDKKINIHQEQGVGDWIFHLRFLSLVKDKYKNISISIDERIHPILKENFPGITFNIDSIIDRDEQNINLATIGRFLINSKDDIKRIKNWTISKPLEKSIINNTYSKTKKNIGLSWMSENKDWGDNKSMDISLLRPLIEKSEYNFINLQYGEIKNQINKYSKSFNIDIKNEHGIDVYNNIYGLAQLINECDIIVTISNLNAHIAGSLGKKTFLLLPKSNGKMWYWTEEEDVSNWYPSVTVIRQNKNESWKESIDKTIDLIEKSR